MSYKRTVLYENDLLEVVSCEWGPDDFSPLHGHGESSCHVIVVEGVFENVTVSGTSEVQAIVETGQVVSTPQGARHRIRCLSSSGKTFHIYNPKINSERKTQFHLSISQEGRQALSFEQDAGLGVTQLRKLLEQVELQTISTDSPFFMNQLFSGVSAETLMAENLIARKKTTLATFEASPVFSIMEEQVIQRLGMLSGWTTTEGVAVPGGSAANFMALHCARHLLFPTAKSQGMPSTKLKVFVSEEAHYSFRKGCMVLGFGTDQLVAVKANGAGKMLTCDLEEKILETLGLGHVPLLVCGTAGTTVKGAFDPLDRIAEICRKYNIWFHVDGAWGAPVLFSEQARSLMTGIEQADSLTFDAHKLFGAGMTCSFFLTKTKGLLLSANDVSGAEYLFHENSGQDLGKLSWQCGRRADAVTFWSILKSQGVQGLGQGVDRLLALQKEALEFIKTQSRLELVADPEFLNICVRVLPPRATDNEKDWSRYVRDQLLQKDLAMVNYSTDSKGSSFLRLILANPEIKIDHIHKILNWALAIQ